MRTWTPFESGRSRIGQEKRPASRIRFTTFFLSTTGIHLPGLNDGMQGQGSGCKERRLIENVFQIPVIALMTGTRYAIRP